MRATLFVQAALVAQTIQSPSSVVTTTAKDGTKTVEIQNVAYQVINGKLLKKSTVSKQVLGEKGREGSVALEAWNLGADTKQKPLVAIKATGNGGDVVDFALFVIARGLEETDWWSVYRLRDGKLLFDTHTPLVSFSTSRETLTTRYVGFAVNEDRNQTKRIGTLTYATEERVLQQWILTCDDSKRAEVLRSFADGTRKVTLGERSLTLSFRDNFPSPPSPVDLPIALVGDELDVAHAKVPPHFQWTVVRS